MTDRFIRPGEQAPGSAALGSPLIFRPAEGRTFIAIGMLFLSVVTLVIAALVLPNHSLWWLALASGVFWLPAIWYSGFMTSPLVVYPGVCIQRRRPVRGVQTVPIDSTTEIVAYTKVGPRGWYVIRSQGRTEMRLCDQYWSVYTLAGVARAAPAALRLHTTQTTRPDVEAAYPDYYSPLDEKYGWLVGAMIFFAVPFLFAALMAAYPLLGMLFGWYPG